MLNSRFRINLLRILTTLIIIVLKLNSYAATVEKKSPSKAIPKYLSSTIFYRPYVKVDLKSCSPANRFNDVFDINGKIITTLCRNDFKDCVMEGACYIEDKTGVHSINYQVYKNNKYRFAEIEHERCPLGMGVSEICLDPFFSLAADLRYFNPGDVVYIPQINGMKLPTGETHNGYFIIRDRGGRILGTDRFDFFTGFYSYNDKSNPFMEAGLSTSTKKFTYVKVKDPSIIAKVKKMRNYPDIPEQVKVHVNAFLTK